MIKRLMLINMLVMFPLITPACGQGGQLCFQWSAYDDQKNDVIGFRMFKNSRAHVVANNIPITATKKCIEVPKETKCVNYFLVAYSETATSDNSNVAVVCPDYADPPLPGQPPMTIGGFKIKEIVLDLN